MSLLEEIRRASAEVAQRARSVRIVPERLAELADRFGDAAPPAPSLDPAHHHLDTPAGSVAFVMTLDAVNFGSGWFPIFRKRPGLSGYFTIASSIKDRFDRQGPWRAERLAVMTAEDCAGIFGQDLAVPAVAELMEHFARAWRELGRFLLERYGGRFAGPMAEAEGSAERLVGILAKLPGYRDVSHYEELEVPFYKRAQITVADLSALPLGPGRGEFHDLDRLTIFADNLVPHVLRVEGVLELTRDLAERIGRGELIAAGSPEEVELRACALEAVERMVARLCERGVATTARAVDDWLWNRGQRPDMKAKPRHRTRSIFY